MSDTDLPEPPYLRRMLTSQPNLYALLTTVIASATLSIPWGGAGAVLPLVVFAAGEAIAALFIPSSPGFRAKVDAEVLAAQRAERHGQLMATLGPRVSKEDRRWQTHRLLQDRAARAHELRIPAGNTSITPRDLDRLRDAPSEYLSLWLTSLDMRQRRKTVDVDELDHRIAVLDDEIAEAQQGAGDLPSLRQAQSELRALRERHERLGGRLAAVEAALLSLPDAVEEIHLALGPSQGAASGEVRLSEALSRLRAQEDIERSLTEEMNTLSLEPVPMAASPRGTNTANGSTKARNAQALGPRRT
ncbi:MAG TPA: hypothetical protein VLA16_10880 [Ideonella sp.]|nr:hypothetical protein [Ideonella sp.]